MSLFLVGLNHITAPIEIRELVAISDEDVESALATLRAEYGFDEAMIISTCNRVEVIAGQSRNGDPVVLIKRFLHQQHSLEANELDDYLYSYSGEELIRHVFRVASSLDSMVQGEPQILGQVKQAYMSAQRSGVTGERLSQLMPRAFFVAKRIRTETRIANAAVSVSSAAVELARKIFEDLAEKSILLLGAGKMGELVVKNLLSSGVSSIMIANRTHERSEEMIARLGGRDVAFDELESHLVEADIVVVATGSSSHVVDGPMMDRVIRRRRYAPLFVIDISVPRNVSPEVNEIENVFLFDIDDLESVIASNIEEREREAELAETIIEQEVESFQAHHAARNLGPFIRSFRQKIEQICLDELKINRNGLSAEDYEKVEKMVRKIARRIAHPLTVQIKRHAVDPDCHDHEVEMIKKAFELEDRE
jgi:glutamyl-tRNA reductase